MECFSSHHTLHALELLYYLSVICKLSSYPMTMLLFYHISRHFFLLFQHVVLIRSSGRSGSEETALVIIHLSIFSHVLLHYSHPSIYTAVRVCHINELQLASPVITPCAVLPFLTAVYFHAKLTLKTRKVSVKCQ